MKRRKHTVCSSLIGMSVLMLAPGGCKLMNNTIDGEVMARRLADAPPVKGEILEERHLLVMQAPNPGWVIELDRDTRDRDGWVVYITIREPDPGFMYPQRIIEKRLLTEVEANQSMRVMARLLTHTEKGEQDDYAPLTLVDQFAP